MVIRPTLVVRLAAVAIGFVAFSSVVVGLVARMESSVSAMLDETRTRSFESLIIAHDMLLGFERLDLASNEACSRPFAAGPEARRRAALGAMDRHLARLNELAADEIVGGSGARLRVNFNSYRREWDALLRQRRDVGDRAAIAPRDLPTSLRDATQLVLSDLGALERFTESAVEDEMTAASASLQHLKRTTLLISGVAAGLFLLGVLLNGRRIVLPLRALARAADRVSRGGLHEQYDVGDVLDDEIHDLADAFRRMTRGLEASTVSRAYLDRILDSMPYCLVVCDPEGRVLTANPAAESLLGWASHDLLGRRFASLVARQASEREQFAMLWDSLKGGVRFEGGELTIRRRDGRAVPLIVSGAVLPDERGGVGGYVFSAADFTERKRAEAELRSAKATAEEAARAKADFLATMSHEIRTPMTAILGFAEILREPELNEEERGEAIQTIQANGRHLVELVNSILDLSKIEAGRLEVERIEVDAWELLEETYRLMNAPAKAKGLRLEMTSLNAIPESIQTDPTRLRQILINLIGNAIKFTENGTILLIVHFHEVPEPQSGLEGPQLEVVVVDSGIGMSDEQVARVFEPFTQADGSMTRRFGGTGLGLTISKQLAVLLGGDIVVSSRPRQGTAFRVSVSTGSVESVPRIGIEEGRARWRDRARKSSVEVASPTLGGVRILLVEDHPVNRRLAERILERAGANVTSVDSGIAALEILRSSGAGVSPDILVTDLHLPGLDGHSLATTVRAEGFAGAIVALSAGQATDELRGAFDAWLGKPIDRRNVVQTLAALASRSRASSTDTEAPVMPLRGRHVLVVEDTPVNQRLVQHILERAGATTALADHGQEAVEKVLAAEESGTSFDVILMDLQMPRLDGVGATRLLREKGVAVPIVALTANATAADRERCLDAGCDEFVPKPIDRRKLLAIVGRLAGRVPAPRV